MPTAIVPHAGRWTRSRKCTGMFAGAGSSSAFSAAAYHLDECDAGVVVDSDMNELPSERFAAAARIAIVPVVAGRSSPSLRSRRQAAPHVLMFPTIGNTGVLAWPWEILQPDVHGGIFSAPRHIKLPCQAFNFARAVMRLAVADEIIRSQFRRNALEIFNDVLSASLHRQSRKSRVSPFAKQNGLPGPIHS